MQPTGAPEPCRWVGGLLRVYTVANGNKVRVLAGGKQWPCGRVLTPKQNISKAVLSQNLTVIQAKLKKVFFFFFLQVWQKLEFLGLSLTLSSKMTSDQKLFCCSAVAHRVGQRPAPTLAAGNCWSTKSGAHWAPVLNLGSVVLIFGLLSHLAQP